MVISLPVGSSGVGWHEWRKWPKDDEEPDEDKPDKEPDWSAGLPSKECGSLKGWSDEDGSDEDESGQAEPDDVGPAPAGLPPPLWVDNDGKTCNGCLPGQHWPAGKTVSLTMFELHAEGI